MTLWLHVRFEDISFSANTIVSKLKIECNKIKRLSQIRNYLYEMVDRILLETVSSLPFHITCIYFFLRLLFVYII